MAVAMDSPVLVTRTLSGDIEKGRLASRDEGLMCFHGPGESPASNGDGRGVTSPMAAIMGLATVELAAEAGPKTKAAALRLGVRDIGRREEAEVLCCRLSDGRARLSVLMGVMGVGG